MKNKIKRLIERKRAVFPLNTDEFTKERIWERLDWIEELIFDVIGDNDADGMEPFLAVYYGHPEAKILLGYDRVHDGDRIVSHAFSCEALGNIATVRYWTTEKPVEQVGRRIEYGEVAIEIKWNRGRREWRDFPEMKRAQMLANKFFRGANPKNLPEELEVN